MAVTACDETRWTGATDTPRRRDSSEARPRSLSLYRASLSLGMMCERRLGGGCRAAEDAQARDLRDAELGEEADGAARLLVGVVRPQRVVDAKVDAPEERDAQGRERHRPRDEGQRRPRRRPHVPQVLGRVQARRVGPQVGLGPEHGPRDGAADGQREQAREEAAPDVDRREGRVVLLGVHLGHDALDRVLQREVEGRHDERRRDLVERAWHAAPVETSGRRLSRCA